MHLTSEDHRNLAEIEEYKKVNWYSEVVKLKAGAAFGELALLNREARSATVQCISKCQFATLDKASYMRVLKQNELRTIEKRV